MKAPPKLGTVIKPFPRTLLGAWFKLEYLFDAYSARLIRIRIQFTECLIPSVYLETKRKDVLLVIVD